MKLLALAASLFFSPFVLAELPNFSAFANGDNLYVTLMADSCNQQYGNLVDISRSCQADRRTREGAVICSASLSVSSTKMACQDQNLVPRVLKINLREANLASEAKLLRLEFRGQEIEIELEGRPRSIY